MNLLLLASFLLSPAIVLCKNPENDSKNSKSNHKPAPSPTIIPDIEYLSAPAQPLTVSELKTASLNQWTDSIKDGYDSVRHSLEDKLIRKSDRLPNWQMLENLQKSRSSENNAILMKKHTSNSYTWSLLKNYTEDHVELSQNHRDLIYFEEIEDLDIEEGEDFNSNTG